MSLTLCCVLGVGMIITKNSIKEAKQDIDKGGNKMHYLIKFENKEPSRQGKKNGEKPVLITTIEGAFETEIDASDVADKTCNGNYLIITNEEDLHQFKGKYLSSLKACLLGGDPSAKVREAKATLLPKLWDALQTLIADKVADAVNNHVTVNKAVSDAVVADSKKPKKKGVMTMIREIFSDNAVRLTIDELMETISFSYMSDAKRSTVLTAITDLNNPKYCGKLGVFTLEKDKEDKRYYANN